MLETCTSYISHFHYLMISKYPIHYFMSLYPHAATYLFSTAASGWYKSLVNGRNFDRSHFGLYRFPPGSFFAS